MTLAINPRRLVQPAHEPLSREEVKLFLRIEHDAEDTLLGTLIQAARESAECLLNISFITQTWQYQVSGHAHAPLPLPYGPVTAITQLAYREGEDSEWSTLASDAYHLRDNGVQIASSALKLPDIKISYTAGFGNDAQSVPARIRHALLQHIAALYESRASTAIIDVGHIYATLREVRL